jgi:two-component system, OmpR family, response regulator
MNVLLIEDDKRIAGLVERGLREEGHSVSISYDGVEGAAMMLAGEYDAALLDIYLPGMDGFQVLETVRGRHCRTPILMLTAVDAVPKVLRAFDLGEDDYLVKPFLLKILIARVGAIARRAQPGQSFLLQAGGVTLDRPRRLATRNGRQIPLTRKQTELLDVLMRRSGLVTSREELIEAAWDDANGVKENTLDVYIHSLRAKLEDRSETKPLIRTVHGTGYTFVAE